MQTMTRTSTTEMEVTSIRLERDLKERLKALSGNQGYQALIRDILWNYVQHRSSDVAPEILPSDIRASVPATARQDDHCVLTGRLIRSGEAMLLGYTGDGSLVPLSLDSLA